MLLPDFRLPSVPTWRYTYNLDFQDKNDCPENLPKNGETVPIGCFYSHHIKQGDSQALKQLTADGNEVVVNLSTDIKVTDVYAILVGVHVMRLTPERPQWEWMTFYWADSDNKQGWKSPWRFFNMMSTDKLRNEAFQGHAFSFNPYLEGPPDGIHANCLDCHRLASFNSVDNSGRAELGAERAAKDYCPNDRQDMERRFFDHAVQTGFIWSLSTSQDNAARSKHESFASALKSIYKLGSRQP